MIQKTKRMMCDFRNVLFIFCAILFTLKNGHTKVLHIGVGLAYGDLQSASNDAKAGDTLMLHEGVYNGGMYIQNLQGKPDQWITIMNAFGDRVIIEGGNNAIQMVDPTYVHIYGIIFQKQTGNGFNLDDGSTYITPAHHIIFEKCTFRDISATGNNDLLKLSGLDHFVVKDCSFENGSTGGSGIDMVGCHFGSIIGNRFENMGSNAIQSKGGSENIRIERNFFKNGGQRALNLGGSTGLAFFRPDTARFEAARIQVYANIFIGSVAPIAFVGAIEIDVAHNTIIRPDKWAIRILQETVDTSRFFACGYNRFRNNIVVLSNVNNVTINIGPNTSPETFTFSNNLWYHADDANWQGPNVPVVESNTIINKDPTFFDPFNEDFSILTTSPAFGKALFLAEVPFDYLNRPFFNPPSIGAFEAQLNSSTYQEKRPYPNIRIFPNPASDAIQILAPASLGLHFPCNVTVLDIHGSLVASHQMIHEDDTIEIDHLSRGFYMLQVDNYKIGFVVLD